MGSAQSNQKELENMKTMTIKQLKRKLSKFKQCFLAEVSWDEHPHESVAVAHIVAAKGLPVHIQLLLDLPSPDMNVTTSHGWSMLHFAVAFNNVDTMNEILKYSTSIDAKENIQGHTVFHMACQKNNLIAVQSLLQNRCDSEVKNKLGKKAGDLASDERIRKQIEKFKSQERTEDNLSKMVESYPTTVQRVDNMEERLRNLEQKDLSRSETFSTYNSYSLSRCGTITSFDSGLGEESEFQAKRRNIQRNYRKLLDRISNTREMVATMFSKEAFAPHILERLKTLPTDTDRNEELLCLVMKPPEMVYNVFLESLRETNQGHLADMIEQPPLGLSTISLKDIGSTESLSKVKVRADRSTPVQEEGLVRQNSKPQVGLKPRPRNKEMMLKKTLPVRLTDLRKKELVESKTCPPHSFRNAKPTEISTGRREYASFN